MQENRHFLGKLSQKMCGIAYFFEEKVTSHLQKCVLINWVSTRIELYQSAPELDEVFHTRGDQ